MKAFHFPLDSVLNWRETQSEREDEKLSRSLAELNRCELLKAKNDEARSTASKSQLQVGGVSGSDFRALGAYLLGLDVSADLLRGEVVKCQHRIQQQQALCLAARRAVKLLDLLKAKRKTAWLHEVDREAENAASENYLGRRARNLV